MPVALVNLDVGFPFAERFRQHGLDMLASADVAVIDAAPAEKGAAYNYAMWPACPRRIPNSQNTVRTYVEGWIERARLRPASKFVLLFLVGDLAPFPDVARPEGGSVPDEPFGDAPLHPHLLRTLTERRRVPASAAAPTVAVGPNVFAFPVIRSSPTRIADNMVLLGRLRDAQIVDSGFVLDHEGDPARRDDALFWGLRALVRIFSEDAQGDIPEVVRPLFQPRLQNPYTALRLICPGRPPADHLPGGVRGLMARALREASEHGPDSVRTGDADHDGCGELLRQIAVIKRQIGELSRSEGQPDTTAERAATVPAGSDPEILRQSLRVQVKEAEAYVESGRKRWQEERGRLLRTITVHHETVHKALQAIDDGLMAARGQTFENVTRAAADIEVIREDFVRKARESRFGEKWTRVKAGVRTRTQLRESLAAVHAAHCARLSLRAVVTAVLLFAALTVGPWVVMFVVGRAASDPHETPGLPISLLYIGSVVVIAALAAGVAYWDREAPFQRNSRVFRKNLDGYKTQDAIIGLAHEQFRFGYAANLLRATQARLVALRDRVATTGLAFEAVMNDLRDSSDATAGANDTFAAATGISTIQADLANHPRLRWVPHLIRSMPTLVAALRSGRSGAQGVIEVRWPDRDAPEMVSFEAIFERMVLVFDTAPPPDAPS